MVVKPEKFISEFDSAIESHMDWTRRVLRCSVLRTLPGEDILSPISHDLCHFGNWFQSNIEQFEAIDPKTVARIQSSHQTMHDAMRSICSDIMSGQIGKASDLDLFDQSQSELLTLLASLKTFILNNAERPDPLTGLPLRHSIDTDFALCQNDVKRNKTMLYLALIDIDHFKKVNDKYGHPVGDLALRHVADTLKSVMRGNDPLYRFGGEEFLCLMRCNFAEEAEQSARRIVIKIRTTPMYFPDNSTLSLTITLGLIRVEQEENLNSAIKRADIALYEGKNSGRDRYVIKYV
jgi:diguanylate cyclase (GGDEF)-like protein